jgi:hypothetical protein
LLGGAILRPKMVSELAGELHFIDSVGGAEGGRILSMAVLYPTLFTSLKTAVAFGEATSPGMSTRRPARHGYPDT